MVNIKKEKIIDYIFLAYLVLFALGQILRGLYITDILILIIAAYTWFTEKSVFETKGKFVTFLIIGIFSLFFSLNFFKLQEIVIGAGYFVRLTSYALLYFFVKGRFKTKEKVDLLVKSLITLTFLVTIFGFIQYFFLPDLRALKILGWDDHYFRLVSTFLDPTFTGIIILIGLTLSVFMYLKRKKNYYLLIGLLDLLAILLTYSRSTFLALLVSFVYLFFLTKKKVVLLFPLLMLLFIPLLPRPQSEGAKLERTYSIFQKVENYESSLVLIIKSPITGFGFNNICQAKVDYLGEKNTDSHSCGGLDNSILMIASTTGLLGVIFFLHLLTQINFKSLFAVVFVGVFIHSMFANSLFYPFVLGLLAILLATKVDLDI